MAASSKKPGQKEKNKVSVSNTAKVPAGSGALPSGSKALPWLMHAWVFIPAVLYFVLVSRYAVNVPMKDDYDAILLFITDFSKAPSLGAKLTLLFRQHNEHRIFSTHLVTALYYSLTGRVNFRDLILLGNLQLLVLFLIFVYFIRRSLPQYWGIVALIAGFCIFDPSSYENGDVAMTCLQNYGIVTLFLISLFFYSLKNKKFLIPAALFQLVAIFSSGNGIPAALIIAVYTLFSGEKWKIVTSLSVLLVFSPLYFYHYVTPPQPPGAKPGIDLSIAIPYFFKMCGAHFNADSSLPAGIGVIIVLLITFPYAKKTLVETSSLPFVCLLAFLILTVGTISLLRSATQAFYASRYLIYPHLLVALAFFFLCKKVSQTPYFWPVSLSLSLLMLYVFSGNYRYGKAGFQRENLRMETYDFYYPDKARAKKIAADACAAQIYCLEDEK